MSDVHTANARLAEIRKAQGIGSVKPIERQNAVILVNQLQRANGINPASLETIGDLAQRIAVNAPKPPAENMPVTTIKTVDDVRRENNVTSFDLLDFSHLSPESARQCASIVSYVRAWAERLDSPEAQKSLFLSGPVGVGKTTLARAAYWKHCKLIISAGSKPAEIYYPITGERSRNYSIDKRAAFYHSWQIMELAGKEGFCANTMRLQNLNLLIVDDLGREGEIPFVKAENQAAERKARYFRLIDAVYNWNHWNPDNKTQLLVTTNLAAAQLPMFFDEATASRLNQMFTIVEFPQIADYRKL